MYHVVLKDVHNSFLSRVDLYTPLHMWAGLSGSLLMVEYCRNENEVSDYAFVGHKRHCSLLAHPLGSLILEASLVVS